ncbi:MAG: alpha/beta fold hydrolase [Myxococcota bacterium]
MVETRYVQAPGLRIAYDDSGSGEPIVLVHGLGSSRRRWADLAGRLRDAGHRVVTYDLRGFGESEPARTAYGVDDLVKDLSAVVRACDLPAFHLVGHSLGGMVAQRFALGRPDRLRSLTLVSTTSHNGRRASAFGRAMAEVCERGFDAALRDREVRTRLEGLLAQAFPGGSPPLDLFRRGLERPHPAQALAWRATVGFSTKDRLRELGMPVLVMHGTDDRVIPVIMGQLIHQAIGGSRLHLIEGAGHHPHRERPQVVRDHLLAFFTGAG